MSLTLSKTTLNFTGLNNHCKIVFRKDWLSHKSEGKNEDLYNNKQNNSLGEKLSALTGSLRRYHYPVTTITPEQQLTMPWDWKTKAGLDI